MDEKSKQIKELKEKIEKLEAEQTRLAHTSYSQSDPGAVMDRRFVNRDLDRARKLYEQLMQK